MDKPILPDSLTYYKFGKNLEKKLQKRKVVFLKFMLSIRYKSICCHSGQTNCLLISQCPMLRICHSRLDPESGLFQIIVQLDAGPSPA